jgi:glycosyltransferase involved in cell wall biosynthesis
LISRVTVCVITYNHIEYIERCLNSILTQEIEFDLEIIVGDDASIDGTREVVQDYAKKYPHLIKLCLQHANTGGTKNYNDVHRMATGNYIAHCYGDDFFLPGKLKQQVHFLNTHPEYSIVWHGMIRFTTSEESRAASYCYQSPSFETFHFEDLLKFGPLGCHSSSMYRASSRPKYEGADSRLDWMYYTDSLLIGKGALLHSVLGGYRVNNGTSLGTGPQVYTVRKLMASHLREILERFPESKRSIYCYCALRCASEIRRNFSLFAIYFFLCIRCFSFVGVGELLNIRTRSKYLQTIRFHYL